MVIRAEKWGGHHRGRGQRSTSSARQPADTADKAIGWENLLLQHSAWLGVDFSQSLKHPNQSARSMSVAQDQRQATGTRSAVGSISAIARFRASLLRRFFCNGFCC